MTANSERLLAEVEDILRTMPNESLIGLDLPMNHAWMGRAAALVARWSPDERSRFQDILDRFGNPTEVGEALRQMLITLNQARHDLRMETGQMSAMLPAGAVWDYFDAVRGVIEAATDDILFVDPYLSADFVTRYLPHVHDQVTIRLLTTDKKLAQLLSAVELFAMQNERSVQVRVSGEMHDRFVITDGAACYHSGASFKDGAKNAPTTLTQIGDAGGAVIAAYETTWSAAAIKFPL